MKKLTEKQLKAHARNALFRQLHGSGFDRFIKNATRLNAITEKEYFILNNILNEIRELKEHQFEGSKAVGLTPKRRCNYCKNVANFEILGLGLDHKVYVCKNHKHIFEPDLGLLDGTPSIIPINPYN